MMNRKLKLFLIMLFCIVGIIGGPKLYCYFFCPNQSEIRPKPHPLPNLPPDFDEIKQLVSKMETSQYDPSKLSEILRDIESKRNNGNITNETDIALLKEYVSIVFINKWIEVCNSFINSPCDNFNTLTQYSKEINGVNIPEGRLRTDVQDMQAKIAKLYEVFNYVRASQKYLSKGVINIDSYNNLKSSLSSFTNHSCVMVRNKSNEALGILISRTSDVALREIENEVPVTMDSLNHDETIKKLMRYYEANLINFDKYEELGNRLKKSQ